MGGELVLLIPLLDIILSRYHQNKDSEITEVDGRKRDPGITR